MANVYANLEAERSVLGCALLDEQCASKTVEMPDSMLTDVRHRAILAAMRDLYAAKMPIDLTTMDSQLTKLNRLAEAGGTAYLIDTQQYVPTTLNYPAYMKILQECHKRRILRAAGQKMINEAGDGSIMPDDLRDRVILGLKETKSNDAPQLITMDTAMERLLDRISEVTKKPEEGRIATGIPPLDKIIRLSAGKLIVIAARPSVGKSSLALQIARDAAGKGKRTLLDSLEMSEDETAARVLATLSGVPTENIETGNLTEEDYRRIGPLCGEIAQMPIFSTMECNTISKLRRAAYAMAQESGLDMIIVDYIQLMSSDNKKMNRNDQISEISRELKLLAKELKIPIVVLSQLNRQSQGGTTKDGNRIRRAPTMAEARDSGAIEQDADIFLILHDPEEAEMHKPEDLETFQSLREHGLSLAAVIVEKNRNGRAKCTVFTAFDKPRVQFLALTRKEKQI